MNLGRSLYRKKLQQESRKKKLLDESQMQSQEKLLEETSEGILAKPLEESHKELAEEF